ncbi:MAG: hypothetical protein M0008_12535 [Actinomycetota bacterium]|nr:hypothetical protein [Actinomycetota bacterium]
MTVRDRAGARRERSFLLRTRGSQRTAVLEPLAVRAAAGPARRPGGDRSALAGVGAILVLLASLSQEGRDERF